MPATGHSVWFMRETLHPASLANPEKAELPPSTQRQMGWRGEVMNPKIFISSDPLAMPPARRRIGCLAPCHFGQSLEP